MDNNLFLAQNCDCDLQIRTSDNYIEYFDTDKQLWIRLYPSFRLYRTSVDVMTLYGNDGRQITIKAGCAVNIDGTNYTDFNDIFNAITTNIVNFFFSVTCLVKGGTTAQRPTSPKNYELYLDFTLNPNGLLIIWNGSNWVNMSAAIV